MTGFRVALGGAQSVYNIKPDLTTLGKIIGGGMPVGAFGGRKDIMQALSPVGPVYQAGTLSGNPIAMAAGLKTLEIISRDGFYDNLIAKTTRFLTNIKAVANKNNIALTTNQAGAMFGLFFSDKESIKSFSEVAQCNADQFNYFFHAMLDAGVNLAPSVYETGFVSSAHSDEDLQQTVDAADNAFANLN
jgi:glutamate-1-semialdehyde 2,1-aminomutase